MMTGALMRGSSFGGLGDLLPCLPGRGRQCLFSHPSRPRWRDHAHAQHPLGRAQEIDSAGNGPPAIARFFEKAKALEPLFLFERRHIAIESAAGDFKPKQCEPVLKPVERDEVAVPRDALVEAA